MAIIGLHIVLILIRNSQVLIPRLLDAVQVGVASQEQCAIGNGDLS
jgi:hypothetical protein